MLRFRLCFCSRSIPTLVCAWFWVLKLQQTVIIPLQWVSTVWGQHAAAECRQKAQRCTSEPDVQETPLKSQTLTEADLSLKPCQTHQWVHLYKAMLLRRSHPLKCFLPWENQKKWLDRNMKYHCKHSMSLAFNPYFLGGDGNFSWASGDQLHIRDQCCGQRQHEERGMTLMTNAIIATRVKSLCTNVQSPERTLVDAGKCACAVFSATQMMTTKWWFTLC